MIEYVPPDLYQEISPRREVVLGSSSLLHLSDHQYLYVDEAFEKLIKRLVEIGYLNKEALKAKTLEELNFYLQAPQGQGGLKRVANVERYEMQDPPIIKQHQGELRGFFKQLGFVNARESVKNRQVDHCLIFGALIMRMDYRIQETLKYLFKKKICVENIYLLGSSRPLIPLELQYLNEKILFFKKEDFDRGVYWEHFFQDKENLTEAYAFSFLWEVDTLKYPAFKQAVWINTQEAGASYNGKEGNRPTTESTLRYWMTLINPKPTQTFFALVEQPYIRLLDLLVDQLLIKQNKKISLQKIHERLDTFDFISPMTKETPLVSVVLDEIARHLYLIQERLDFFRQLIAAEKDL